MTIQLADVTLHIDENLGPIDRGRLDDVLRAIDGVVSVHNPAEKPHLAVVEYIPAKTSSSDILTSVRSVGMHAELIGL
jgi:hypothetical protein